MVMVRKCLDWRKHELGLSSGKISRQRNRVSKERGLEQVYIQGWKQVLKCLSRKDGFGNMGREWAVQEKKTNMIGYAFIKKQGMGRMILLLNTWRLRGRCPEIQPKQNKAHYQKQTNKDISVIYAEMWMAWPKAVAYGTEAMGKRQKDYHWHVRKTLDKTWLKKLWFGQLWASNTTSCSLISFRDFFFLIFLYQSPRLHSAIKKILCLKAVPKKLGIVRNLVPKSR